MSISATDYIEAIAHLPAGATLRIDNVPWDAYEQLLSDLGESYGVRIFYDQGRMEIMAPGYPHERAKNVIHTLVGILRDELGIDVESAGSTTFKLEMKEKGAEPDDSFYVQNASRIIGKEDLKLASDPPPDVVVEVERTSSSLSKFPIYAAMKVPEIWRVAKKVVHIHLLSCELYDESPTSRAFPFLSGQILSQFLAKGLIEGESSAAREFRAWVRSNKS